VGQAPPSKWARVRQTNPIQPGRQTRRGSRRRKCAKRTQSSPAGRQVLSREDENVRNKPNWARLHPATGPIAPNKPNLARPVGGSGPRRAKTCETNPIWGGSSPQVDSSAPNKPNLGQAGRPAGAPGSENVRNEPNLGRRCRHRRDRTCETNPICTALTEGRFPRGRRMRNEPNLGRGCRHRRDRMCETNPIPGGAGWDRASGTRGRRGCRAKQSQSPRYGVSDPDMENFSPSLFFCVDIYYAL
jgi:hypothetical protein